MLSLRIVSLTAALAFGAMHSLAFAQDNPMVGGAPMFADKNIVENAVNSKDHTTLVAAVQAAGLVETLAMGAAAIGAAAIASGAAAPGNKTFDDIDDAVRLIDIGDGDVCDTAGLVCQRDLIAVHLGLQDAAADSGDRVCAVII